MFCLSELGSKDLSDYKNSKAYSSYKSGWLQHLQYHNLSGSKYCIIKGECRKSQSIKDLPHKLWILKKTAKIRTCHCTCMATLRCLINGGETLINFSINFFNPSFILTPPVYQAPKSIRETYNWVAAAMYRVEAAVRIGLTNPACTSNTNEWLPN